MVQIDSRSCASAIGRIAHPSTVVSRRVLSTPELLVYIYIHIYTHRTCSATVFSSKAGP